MKLSKFTVILAVLLISIMAIGAVSAESVDDSGAIAIDDGGEVQESIADDVGDLGTADTADLAVNDEGSAVLGDEAASYDLNDTSYSTYFNDDGTATEVINESSDYTLVVDTLTNKDIIITYGSHINIVGKEGSGFINNGTITIGDGTGEAGSITISGLTFTNTNKDGIYVNQLSTDITIDNNKFDLTYDSSYYNSPMAIATYGYVYDVKITNNNIKMVSAAAYTYGIDLYTWLPDWSQGLQNAENMYVANNVINITSTYISSPPYTGAVEGMYLDSIINSCIENNTVYTYSGEGVANYAIAVADSWGTKVIEFLSGDDDDYYGGLSPYNITIKDNNVYIESDDMAYGITAISWMNYDDWADKVVKDMVISNNKVTIYSKRAIGIGVQTSDVEVTDNNINVNANNDAVTCYPDPAFGIESYAILVDNFYSSTFGLYYNTTIKNNVITTNVPTIFIERTEGTPSLPVEPIVVEDNEIINTILIDDSNYDTYFNTDGTIKDGAINPNDIIILGELTGKKLVINMPLTINAVPNKKLVNTKLNITAGADGTVIDGLNVEYEVTAYTAVILVEEVSNVTISNCVITIPSATKMAYAIEIGPGPLGCNNIYINNNVIDVQSSYTYAYGINVYQQDDAENKHNGIYIFENHVSVSTTGEKMAQAIYVTASKNVIIDGNILEVTSSGSAYGIGTDRIADEVITNNKITLEAATMAYGITATTEGNDVIIRANDINAKGTGAVGVGINHINGATIEDNTIAIDGGNYTSITPSDNLGTANAGILVGEGNTNVKSSGNDVTETSALRLDTTIVVSDLTVTAAPSGNGTLQFTLKTTSGMVLANQVVKVVFNNQMYELTTDANGVAKLSFALNKAGTYNVEFFYLGDDNYRGSDATAKIKINKIATKTTSAAKTYLATASSKAISATLKDAKGNVLANKKVTFTVNGKTYTATTNAKGVATVKLALTAAKTYTVSIKFAGDNVYAASTVSAKVKLNKEATKINAPAKTFKRKAKTKKVVITLKNSKNKVVANKKVVLTVNKKNYTVKTNKKGQATFNIKLTKKGTFKYTVKFAGDSQYKAVKKTGKIKIK